jgi:hypothetical protein
LYYNELRAKNILSSEYPQPIASHHQSIPSNNDQDNPDQRENQPSNNSNNNNSQAAQFNQDGRISFAEITQVTDLLGLKIQLF